MSALEAVAARVAVAAEALHWLMWQLWLLLMQGLCVTVFSVVSDTRNSFLQTGILKRPSLVVTFVSSTCKSFFSRLRRD